MKASIDASRPVSDAGAHVGDFLVEQARDLPHPGDVALVLRGIAKLMVFVEIGPEAAVAVERHFPGAEAIVDQRILEHRAEHRGIHLLVGRKLVGGNRVQLVQQVLNVRLPVQL
jgi:hypothetical protein